jgi:NADH dehydrogenase FAD-containing subunit
MYNKQKEDKMEKTILVVEVIKYKNIPTAYHIKKTADNLEKASEYLVSLRNLNDAENTTYELFNAFGQFEVDRIEKVEREETDEIRF